MLFLCPFLNKRNLLIGCFLFLFPSFLFAQNLDSLLTLKRAETNDSIRIRGLNEIGFRYIFSNADRAIEIIEEGLKDAEKSGYTYGFVELTNTKGVYMDVTGKSDSAEYYFRRGLELSRLHDFKAIETRSTNNLGMFNWNRGNYEEAQSYFFKALRMNDELGDEKTRHIYLNNIGLIFQEMNQPEKALEYHKQAYELRVKYDNKVNQATSLVNIGICQKNLGLYDEAVQTYKTGLDIAKATNNLRDYYNIWDNLGNVYQLQGKYRDAIEAYKNSLKVPEDLGTNKRGELSTYTNLIRVYNRINQPREAESYIEKGFEVLEEFPQYSAFNNQFYMASSETNYMLDNFSRGRELTELFIKFKDSLFSEDNAKAIADLEVKYETEQKEKQLLVQRAELAEQEVTIQRRTFQLWGVILIFLLLGVLGYFIYKQQRLKNAQLKKENELKDALAEIETRNKLQEQRLRISKDLHDNIGSQLTFIISSLDNLKYGFELPEKLEDKLQTIGEFTSSTILELRDTIWAMNKSEISVEDLQSRLTNFIEKAKELNDNTIFEISIEPSISEQIKFSSLEGINIYRIVQEAVNNAIKYSEAKNVLVHMSQYEGQLGINITDNGKGFDRNNVDLGNGLNNMKKRATEIDAKFMLNSKIGEGTQVSILLPVNT